jgi:hypothetical protein
MDNEIGTNKVSAGASENDKNPSGRVCPFLGVTGDPGTAISFPSLGNHCFHAKPAQPVRMDAQRIYCLGTNYRLCEEFNKPPGTPLLVGLRSGKSVKRRNATLRSILWVLLPVVAVAGLILWQFLTGWNWLHKLIPPPTIHVTATVVESGIQTQAVVVPQVTDTPTPTLKPSNTPRPSLTFTPTIEMPHALETPIGVDKAFIIHRILDGESLPFLASHYWTTIEAIQAVNYYLPTPIRVGWLVVIPSNLTDVSGLPAFDVYQVETDVTVEDLARQLSTDVALLKQYNSLHDSETILSGAWLLIPHNGTAIP